MSSDSVAIRVRNVSKRYLLYDSPKDRLKQSIIPRLQRLAGGTPRMYHRDFLALEDVSFEVRCGETVGIIGRNGSGKSTLLQIICGTLRPSSGTAEVKGRVAALLELGAGFNPDFTGRENVYMNGAILGLDRDEVDRRFNDIAAFADIGDFLDQPVRTYSSGMYVRLAFAVLAHVDADILVIDEALAVGDATFVQKCMRFLRRFKQHGTILFVSHDTGAVVNFCDTAIWLSHGHIEQTGTPKEVTESYLRQSLQEAYGKPVSLHPIEAGRKEASAQPPAKLPMQSRRRDTGSGTCIFLFANADQSSGWETGGARIESVSLIDRNGEAMASLDGGEQVCLILRARAQKEIHSPILGFFVKDRLGQSLFGEHTFTYLDQPLTLQEGQSCEARFDFQMPHLPNGDYSMTVSIAEGTPWEHIQHHWIHDALVMKVSSDRLRYGLMGIEFQSVSMELAS